MGITPRQLDGLVDREPWRRWCLAEPGLSEFGPLNVVCEPRGEPEDRALGAPYSACWDDGARD